MVIVCPSCLIAKEAISAQITVIRSTAHVDPTSSNALHRLLAFQVAKCAMGRVTAVTEVTKLVVVLLATHLQRSVVRPVNASQLVNDAMVFLTVPTGAMRETALARTISSVVWMGHVFQAVKYATEECNVQMAAMKSAVHLWLLEFLPWCQALV